MTRASSRTEHPAYSAALEGLQVIEASAGTGKTWTISGLYLRLLLERDAEVGQILAVTFTIAAAAELRDRIRARIRDMLEALEGRAGERDAFIAWMLPRITDRQKAILQLRRALASFDEARISTIHGYCQRALAEHAFGSGVAFQCELLADTSGILHEVAADFWRLQVAGCAAAGASADDRGLLADWMQAQPKPKDVSLARLEKLGLSYARRLELEIREPVAPPDLPRDLAAFRQAWAECAALWKRSGADVRKLLCEWPVLSRQKYRITSVEKWCQEIAPFLQAPAAGLPAPETLAKFTADKIRDACKGKPLVHPFFEAVTRLVAAGEQAEQAATAAWTRLRLDFIAYARTEIERRLAERNVQSFDDLLIKLSRALEADGGKTLAAEMRKRCPYALIDEFQDTDPLQWKIVQAVYGGRQAGTAVFLVGDPKQAIYSFRGADVHAYLAAAATCGESLPLLENQRSVPGLLEALNALFEPVDNPFLHEQIQYLAVSPADRPRPALVEAGVADAAPLRVAFLESQPGKAVGKGVAAGWAKGVVVDEIVRLLDEGQAGRITLGDRPLRAGDIAVLVNTNKQAAQVRQALGERGVSSAEMSTLSVFASAEAEQLQRVLQAMSTPRDPGAVRGALATDLIGLGADELVALEDDQKWEAVLGEFARYHDTWNRVGVMRALRELFRERQTYARLALFRNGERRLTNVYHLCELLNLEEQHLHGVESLIAWLAARRETLPTEDMQLRLDSDANLVQIVTIHRSKGLEYPVTFVPFLWDGGSRVEGEMVTYHGDAPPYPMILDARDPAAHVAQAQAEELGERRRVAYVALTRAKNRCYLLSGAFNKIDESALGGVLAGPGDLARLLKQAGKEVLRFEPRGGAAGRRAAGAPVAKFAVRTPRRVPPAGFAETSFSGLQRGAEARDEPGTEKDHDQEVTPAPPRPVEAPGIRETFPAGPRAGNCLHDILEKAGAARAGLEDVIRRELKRAGYDEKMAPQVGQWLQETLATPLPADAGTTVRLADVDAAAQMKELDFQLAAPRFSPAQLVRLARDHGIPMPDLRAPDLHGYLTGAIDLIYRHEGRWYVADYKSNRLESAGQGYALAAMEGAMAEHNYHLQYLIYTVALHRWLRSWLDGYDYDEHVGGVRYLFLRGMHPDWKDAQGNALGVFACRPPRALIEALDACFGTPQAERAA